MRRWLAGLPARACAGCSCHTCLHPGSLPRLPPLPRPCCPLRPAATSVCRSRPRRPPGLQLRSLQRRVPGGAAPRGAAARGPRRAAGHPGAGEGVLGVRAVQVRRAGAGARGGPPGAAAAAAGCWSALSVLGSSAGGWRLRWVHAVRAKAFNPAGPCVFTLLAPPPPGLAPPPRRVQRRVLAGRAVRSGDGPDDPPHLPDGAPGGAPCRAGHLTWHDDMPQISRE